MGQKLRNAPVYFTIVQARFNPILALDTYAPKVQESLRKQGFPDAQKGVLATFNLSLGSPREAPPRRCRSKQTTRYTFLNIERTAGFVLDQAALSFQTTEYDVFESFSAAFLAGLRTVHEVVDLSYTAAGRRTLSRRRVSPHGRGLVRLPEQVLAGALGQD